MKDLMDEIKLKLELYLEGIRIEPSALEGVGSRYKENITYLFDYNYDFDPRYVPPLDYHLPLGSLVRVSYRESSPYVVRRENGQLFVERDGRFLSTLEWTRRPDFYDRLTSDGIEMKKIGQIQGDCCMTICFTNTCLNWRDGNECRYCNINSAQKDALNKGTVLITKKPQQIGEVAAAWLEEVRQKGLNFHSILVAGTLPGKKASDITIEILQAIREHTGLSALDGGLINIAAPKSLEEIDRLYEAGARNVAFNLEVWDPDMFKVICPGKNRNIGRDTFLQSLEHAGKIFGRTHVCSVFVCGLEEKAKYLEAARYLSERGAWILAAPWIVMKGSRLEGHRTPTTEWHLEVNEQVLDILIENIPEILTEEFFRSGNLTCYRCQPFTIFWDLLRVRLGGLTIPLGIDGAPCEA